MAAKKSSRNSNKGPIVVTPPKQNDPGLVGTMAKTAAIAGTATVAVAGTSAAIGAITGPSAEEQAAAAQLTAEQQAAAAQLTAEQQAAAQQAAAGLTAEQMEQLKQLAALKDSGILTDAEFEAQKAEILAA